MSMVALGQSGETSTLNAIWELNQARYKTLKTIGRGTYGWVEEVRDEQTGAIYAKKFIPVSSYMAKVAKQQAQQRVQQEIEILRRVSDPHIVEFRDAYAGPRGFCIVMSPLADCDLAVYYGLCEEKDYRPDLLQPVRMWFSCLSAGLAYLHENRIRHKDIKPQNILIKDGNAMFTDFGIARDFETSEETTSSTEGYTPKTPMYCPPEAYNEGIRKYPADVFSLGCVFAEMATILTRRSVSSFYDFRVAHIEGRETHAFHATLDLVGAWLLLCQNSFLKDFILSMLSVDPQHRPTSRVLHKELTYHAGLIRCEHASSSRAPLSVTAPAAVTGHGAMFPSLKIMVTGGNLSGKTGLTMKFCSVEKDHSKPSDCYEKTVIVDGVACTIEVFVLAPHEYYAAIQDQRIRNSDGFLLTYSITNQQSFDRVRHYHARIMKAKDGDSILGRPPIILVGTNCERLKERQVHIVEADGLATELGCGFFEASAKKGLNVEQVFHEVVRQIRKQRISSLQYSLATPLPQQMESKENNSIVRNQSSSRFTPPTTPRLWDRILGRYAKISGRISPPVMAANSPSNDTIPQG